MESSSPATIHSLIPQLSELELAFLICLVADKHCVVRARETDLSHVEARLASISSGTFDFTHATVDCSPETSLADFSRAVLPDVANKDQGGSSKASTVVFHRTNSPTKSSFPVNTLDERRTYNVIIVRNLHQASQNVQIQALELMRSRRIYSHSAAHGTPKRFLFVALIPDSAPGPPFLTPHLNDQFLMLHDETTPTSSTPSLRSRSSVASMASAASVIHNRPSTQTTTFTQKYNHAEPPIKEPHIAYLASLVPTVRPSAAISRYLHDIPTFLRLHRHVAGGVSALATRHLSLLSQILAVLQLPDPNDPRAVKVNDPVTDKPARALSPVITPTLAVLAAVKVYGHRIELVQRVEDERSMQWGSDADAVEENLRGASVLKVLDETLAGIAVPA